MGQEATCSNREKASLVDAPNTLHCYSEEPNAEHTLNGGPGQNRTGYACLFRAALYR